MNLQILAQNVRRLRTAKRLSQKNLADVAGLSLPSIKNLELAKSEPRMRTIQAIARALDVKIQVLFQPVRELHTVRFRSTKRMQNRENVLAEVARWLDDFNFHSISPWGETGRLEPARYSTDSDQVMLLEAENAPAMRIPTSQI